jgi:hypothetical protein
MAARRLIILMVLLLAVSTIAAALAPQQEQSSEDSSTSTTTTTEPPTPTRGGDGELVRATIDTAAAKPKRVEVAIGHQVALEVLTAEPAQIMLADFGLIEDAAAGAPARFDVLAKRPGEFPIQASTFEESERVVGTLVVSEAPAGEAPPAS